MEALALAVIMAIDLIALSFSPFVFAFSSIYTHNTTIDLSGYLVDKKGNPHQHFEFNTDIYVNNGLLYRIQKIKTDSKGYFQISKDIDIYRSLGDIKIKTDSQKFLIKDDKKQEQWVSGKSVSISNIRIDFIFNTEEQSKKYSDQDYINYIIGAGSLTFMQPHAISYLIDISSAQIQQKSINAFAIYLTDEEIKDAPGYYNLTMLEEQPIDKSVYLTIEPTVFYNAQNKKNYEKLKKEEARLSKYLTGDAAYSALFRLLSIGSLVKFDGIIVSVITGQGILVDFEDYGAAVFVVCNTGNLVDNMRINVEGKITGKHKYTAVGGALRTVPQVNANAITRYY